MGGAPPPVGPRSAAKFLTRCFDVLTFSVGLNVTTTTKKRSSTFLGEKCTARENPGYAYVGMDPHRMVNSALVFSCNQCRSHKGL